MRHFTILLCCALAACSAEPVGGNFASAEEEFEDTELLASELRYVEEQCTQHGGGVSGSPACNAAIRLEGLLKDRGYCLDYQKADEGALVRCEDAQSDAASDSTHSVEPFDENERAYTRAHNQTSTKALIEELESGSYCAPDDSEESCAKWNGNRHMELAERCEDGDKLACDFVNTSQEAGSP